jgi:hypothetical protein
MTNPLRAQQYQGFRKLASSLDFGRIRQATLRTRVTVDTDGAQEAAASTGWTASFLADATTLPLALRTTEPMLTAGNPLSNEWLVCARAYTVVLPSNVAIATHTDIELAEICKKLGLSVLQVKTGPDVIIEEAIGYAVSGHPGIDTRQATLDTAAAPTVRGRLHPMKEGQPIDDPTVIFPGGSLTAVIHGEGAWTGTDDVIVDLHLHCWVALKGHASDTAKVAGLSDLMMRDIENLRARARV